MTIPNSHPSSYILPPDKPVADDATLTQQLARALSRRCAERSEIQQDNMDGAAAPSGQYPNLDIYPDVVDSTQAVEQLQVRLSGCDPLSWADCPIRQEDEICWICMEPPAPGEDLKQWVRPWCAARWTYQADCD